MNMPMGHGLSHDIETAIRAVPGVTEVFRTGGILSNVVNSGSAFLGVRQDEPRIGWRETPDGPYIEVGIGVNAAAGAVDTSHRVHEAITALCTDRGSSPAGVRITVVHVETRMQV